MAVGCGSPVDATGPDANMIAGDGAIITGDASTDPTAAQLLGKLATCMKVGGNYATDVGSPQTISICGLPSAVFWKADLDVDCDGKQTTVCNSTTDPAFQNQTSATDSHGNALDAAA